MQWAGYSQKSLSRRVEDIFHRVVRHDVLLERRRDARARRLAHEEVDRAAERERGELARARDGDGQRDEHEQRDRDLEVDVVVLT